jgi:hypothetical protein
MSRLLDEAETGPTRPNSWRMMTAVRGKKINFDLEQTMKAKGRVKIHLLSFLTSALVGGGWSTPRPVRFTFADRSSILCIGGWAVPRLCLDGCGTSLFHRDSIPIPSSS